MKIFSLGKGKGRRGHAVQTESFVFRYPHCTLLAHTETYLTGMLKCEYLIMFLFPSKRPEGSRDIQGKSPKSQRSSLLGSLSPAGFIHLTLLQPHCAPPPPQVLF